jgi:hypothetical protein
MLEFIRKGGGLAFPFSLEFDNTDGSKGVAYSHGMTLRDYFAAKVIDGFLEHCSTYESASVEAYKLADAMLKAREQ